MQASQIAKTALYAAAALCAGASVAHAGKSANVQACVNLAVPTSAPVTFNFTPVSTNCMNSTGTAATLTTSEAGVSCVSIGYVEAQGSGWCAFESSTWNLSYAAKGTPWSGSTQSSWATGVGITLSAQSPKTSVNTSAAASTATQLDWNDNGPIYIIFTPGATANFAATANAAAPALSPVALYLNARKRLLDEYVNELAKLNETSLDQLKATNPTKPGDLEAANASYLKAFSALQDKYVKAQQALPSPTKP